jgi:hypothetical protein
MPSNPSGHLQEGWLLSNGFSLVAASVALQISRRPGSPESLPQLLEIARSNANNAPGFAFGKDEKAIQSKDKKVRELLRMV